MAQWLPCLLNAILPEDAAVNYNADVDTTVKPEKMGDLDDSDEVADDIGDSDEKSSPQGEIMDDRASEELEASA